ncbi:MAG: hypothetical protein QJR11_02180 [Fulvimonas sp.]|nr:hypothetical protein [Fulvimonas sp.]
MKRYFGLFSCALLAACAGRGLHDTTPKLSSHTGKNVAAYAECIRGRWDGLGVKTEASIKDQEARLFARDDSGARELIELSADGSGAQVVMYETQDTDKKYDARYRDAAIACL